MLFVGQVHSLHFNRMHSTVREWFGKRGIHIESTLVCGWPVVVSNAPTDCDVFDYASYGFVSPRSMNDWETQLFLTGHNDLPACVARLKNALAKESFDLIWIHDLQAGGYLLMDAVDVTTILPPIVATLYGNDLYFFNGHASHRSCLTSLLRHVSVLHAETQRDRLLAEQLGYQGSFTTVASATLAVHEEVVSHDVGPRSIFLLVKGSYRWRSDLMAFFDLIDRNPGYFRDRRVVVFGASPEDRFHCERLRGGRGVDVLALPLMTQVELKRLMSDSQFHLSVTASDGVANTCVEAAIQGCLPFVTRHNGFAELLDADIRSLLVLDAAPDDMLLDRIERLARDATEHQRVLRVVQSAVKRYFSVDSQDGVLRSVAGLLR
jgi:glycosyltransferase involved in cell wall biosynthesis